MFALMRRGLSRGLIRYTLYSLGIGATLGILLADILEGRAFTAGALVLEMSISVQLLFLAVWRRIDQHVEDSGRSLPRPPNGWMFRLIIWLMCFIDIWLPSSPGRLHDVRAFCDHFGNAAFLLFWYTVYVPPKAPDRKEQLVPKTASQTI